MKKLGTKVYIASTKELDQENRFKFFYETVSLERRQKIDRLRFEKDKKLSLAAELLRKKAFALNGIREGRIIIGENGKPYLEGEDAVYFNLSHSEEKVMCVISDREAGCDVEYMKTPNYKVAEWFLTEKEREMLDRFETEEEKRTLFYRFWTLKESFVKAVGLGMQIDLKAFHFSFHEDTVSVCQNINQNRYFFKEYDLGDGYRYALCSLNEERAPLEEIELTK